MKRVESKRNGIIPCIVHENYQPKLVKDKNAISWRFIDFLYSKIILTVPGKVLTILLTITVANVGIVGSYGLEQWFDPEWFLPKGTYLSEYLIVRTEQFPGRGHPASVFIGDIQYHDEFTRILTLTESLQNMTTIDHVESWPQKFAEFVRMYYDKGKTMR